MSALIIGLIAGAFCFWMVTVVKARFGYDDSLDAFGVHGAGGTIGALLTGVFASSAINPIFKKADGTILPSGVLEGNFHQILNQLVGIAIAWALAIVGTLVILFVVDKLIGLRVSEESRAAGTRSFAARRRGIFLGDFRVDRGVLAVESDELRRLKRTK